MTVTRVTGSDGKEYDVTFNLTPATIVPATVIQGDVAISSISPVVDTPPPSNFGLISGFKAANGGSYSIDGIACQNDNPNRSWSMVKLSDYVLRTELRSGDRWSDGTERCEVSFFNTRYSNGTQINLSETITVQPGPVNKGSWCVLNQLHAVTNVSPTYAPFHVNLNTADRLQIVLQSPANGNNYIYTSPSPIVRGQPMSIVAQMMMAPAGGGFVRVWLNGSQIVNFTGAVGATNSAYWWKMGVYRGNAPETIIVDHANWHVTTV